MFWVWRVDGDVLFKLKFFHSQVRETAAATFSGLVHYGFFELNDELQVRSI